jgi:acyl-coenzyme A thioesterase PaaI-like protein
MPTWPDLLNEFRSEPPSPRRRELHRTGEALRRIVHRLHASPAPDAELAAAADELERLAARLDAFPNGAAYEGPPGCVHGGFVAAAFDEVLGSTQSLAGRPGMTARLIVNYRSPTPLQTELRFVGRVVRVEGRKTFTEGTVHAGDRLCAESEALFVAIDLDRVADMRQQRDAAFGPDAAG